MGSLMAGWDSPVLMDPDTVKLERNKSHTKEEIDTFWKIHKKTVDNEDDYTEHFNTDSPKSDNGLKSGSWSKMLQKSKSTNTTSPSESLVQNKLGDWWMKSNWAFLNEPSLDEFDESAHKYVAQFDVAQIATK